VIKVDEGKHINLTLRVIDVEEYRGKCIDIVEIKDGDNSLAPLLGNIHFCIDLFSKKMRACTPWITVFFLEQ
jgi:hypothetical protein